MNLERYIIENKGAFTWEKVYSKKKICIMIVFFVLGVALLLQADNAQQNRFKCLRQGYENMQNEQYSDATEKFEKYLEVDSNLYWYLLELFNDDSYSRQEVMAAKELFLRRCESFSVNT